MSRLLTVREVGALLNVCPRSVYRWTKNGRLPCVHVGDLLRFPEEEIRHFIEQRKVGLADPAIFCPQPEISLALATFDRVYLKPKGGKSVVGKTPRRWRYAFGTVFKRQTKRGDSWCVSYYTDKGRRVRQVVKGAQDRGEAVLFLQRKAAEVFDGKFNPSRKPQRLTFAEISEMFVEGYAKRAKVSWRTDDYRLHKIKAFFEGVSVSEIDESKILEFREARLKDGISRLTANREIALLKKMFSWAVEKGFLKENPARRVKMFSERDTARDRVLAPREEERLFSELSGHLKALVFMAINTGLRLGELLALAWTSIDFERKRIKIERTKSKRARFVGLNSALVPELVEMKSRAKSRLVFPLNRSSVRTGFENACRKAEIEGFTFHDLRRTFGTRLLERGVDLITIQKLYGHASVLVTQNYLHPTDELAQEAVESLVEAPKKPENLALIWHATREKESGLPVSRIFSVN